MKYSLLDKINSPADIKRMNSSELEELCSEIRSKEIDVVSKNGGHLSSNLGVVELTVAMHYVFNSPLDQFVFDVGHQCYAHKILTGRNNEFDTLRQENGISGFPRPIESEHDIFFSGHSGTSVSSGLGLAQAKTLNGDEHYVISVIGDGSFTGGMVYEAMNNGGRTKNKQIIILNDNRMSISENVGSFAKYLAVIRSSPKYYNLKDHSEQKLNSIPAVGRKFSQIAHNLKNDLKNAIYPQSTFFEDLGYRYMGPVDGHDLRLLIMALESAKKVNGPVLLHVITVKGKGYDFAEQSPSVYHGISTFNVETGEPIHDGETYSSQMGSLLSSLAFNDKRICAVTAAMSLGTGLEEFRKYHPNRFFDVGIAEEHAVPFCAGLAKNGMLPVFAVYSTFLQRCYDQLIHDIALQGVKVIFAVDRAGFVGQDGETHNGLFDTSFLNSIPNIKIYSPCSFSVLKSDFQHAIHKDNVSVAIRYPRGCPRENVKLLENHSFEFSTFGNKSSENLLITYGRLTSEAIEAAKLTNSAYIIALNQIKPLPVEAIEIAKRYNRIIFLEEGIRSGSIGQSFALKLLEFGFKGEFKLIAVDDEFVPPSTYTQLIDKYKMNAKHIIKYLNE